MTAALAHHKPFNFQAWIDSNVHLLKPPVANKLVFENTGMVVQVIGGPNQRVDFHDDPVEEFFYQLKGDMILKVAESGQIFDVPIKQGEVFMLPPHARHSPQRPIAGSIGLVVEGTRMPHMRDAFEWFCFKCGDRVHRVELELQNIVTDLPPLFDAFYQSLEHRTCKGCGTIHPGKQPPPGWVTI
ncbi:MAG: 3-hydroxyanthranilate 3,4-dioxygenase [Rhodospirillaceae bacterium]|nr:3-hydroxyanthranilate 3,4-dioxygenase [Rhodospirillaceae bacterium]